MFASVVAIVSYVLGALGFYAIANRRGIKHAWLAWVPVGNLWLLGCISDQYQSLVKGKVKSKRKILLALSAVQALCGVAIVVLCIAMIIQLFALGAFLPDEELYPGLYEDDFYTEDIYSDPYDDIYGDPYDDIYDDFYEEEIPAEMMGSLLAVAATGGILCLLTIPMLVVQYIALYDVFVSCDPGNAVLFLLLSIFLNISPFLVFAVKEKDLGMPPPAPPVQPYYQMSSEQPPVYTAYQQPPVPPQPVEPWEQKTEE